MEATGQLIRMVKAYLGSLHAEETRGQKQSKKLPGRPALKAKWRVEPFGDYGAVRVAEMMHDWEGHIFCEGIARAGDIEASASPPEVRDERLRLDAHGQLDEQSKARLRDMYRRMWLPLAEGSHGT